MEQSIKLTQFSPGAGCGCKISPRDLQDILAQQGEKFSCPQLLVGYETSDDAAVFDLGNGESIISTTDFFTPIVDDPRCFGAIAATNAISDVYAMGGKPLMAIAILGWPLEKLPKEMANLVVEGARGVCAKAGIPLAGGHSISIGDPIFGLAVTGIIKNNNIKQNCKAKAGDRLFLTKPLGVGIVTTAEKRGIVKPEHQQKAIELMTTLNKPGETFGSLPYVTAMTDVTGFGLLGHLLEICKGSNLQANIDFDAVPKIDGYEWYVEQKATPGGTMRNWKSYGKHVGSISEMQKMILCDPQTSGGLLVAVNADKAEEFRSVALREGTITEIGSLEAKNPSNDVFINIS